MRVQRLKWSGHVVMMIDSRAPKQIVGKYVGERRPVGKPRNEWEDEVLKGVPKLLNTKNWRTAAKYRGDGRKKTDQEGGGGEEEEEEEGGGGGGGEGEEEEEDDEEDEEEEEDNGDNKKCV